MADPNDGDLSSEEILRRAEEAFDGGCRLFEAGHLPDAIAAFMRALEFSQQAKGTELQQASCLNNTGNILGGMGQYEEALSSYRDALDTYRTLPGTQKEQATCLNNTGNTLRKVGRYEEALTSFRDALDTYRGLPDTQREQATCLNNTGITLYEVGRYEEARTPFRRALTPAIISALKSNAARFQFPTEHDRLTWITERAEPSLDLALHLASINDQPALASDLIATFRTGGSIDITRLATQNGITYPGQSSPSLTISFEDSTPSTAPTPTNLALTASPPLGADATPSANLPRRPGPVLHMPHHRTALADYHSDDDTTRPHAHYR